MSQIAIYQNDSGTVDVRLDGETVWLTQEQMTQLFGRERSVITKHVRNVFGEGELQSESVCANFAHTAQDGKTYQVLHYNLDVIISVGYRVKSPQGVQFRQWATRLLRQHLTQGYTLNRQRLEANAAELEAALELVAKPPKRPTSAPTRAGGWWTSSPATHTPFCGCNGMTRACWPTPPRSPAAFCLPQSSGAFLFVDFLHRNGRLLNAEGQPVINDVGLAALALLVAESAPVQKEVLIRLVVNMLAKNASGA